MQIFSAMARRVLLLARTIAVGLLPIPTPLFLLIEAADGVATVSTTATAVADVTGEDASCALQTRATDPAGAGTAPAKEADPYSQHYPWKPHTHDCNDVETNHCNLYRDTGLCHTEMVAWACMKTCGSCGICRDLHPPSDCTAFRHRGLCSHHLKTRVYCRKSCGLCNAPGPVPAPVPVPLPAPTECQDRDQQNCNAYKLEGGCSRSQNVRDYCQRTCALCPDQCIDIDPHCEAYRKEGSCSSPNVQAYCRKSCGLCQPAPSPQPHPHPQPQPVPLPQPQPQPQPSECRDLDSHCGGYKAEFLCAKSANIQNYCKKTCGFCPGQCIDLDTNNCQAYKAEGNCERSHSVKVYCRRTCGLCGVDLRSAGADEDAAAA